MKFMTLTAMADRYLPDWSTTQFIVLDRSRRWAAPIAAQVAANLHRRRDFSGRPPEFETCDSAKDVLLFCDQPSTLGVILMMTGVERDCLTLLARIARIPARPPVLAICSTAHAELLPLLLEAGVHTALFDVVNDVPIADWCLNWVSQ
ncbi:MAG: hypothetical protein R3C59_04310 [Planctomycetaceae bacterium]